jgi:hypothetical protein
MTAVATASAALTSYAWLDAGARAQRTDIVLHPGLTVDFSIYGGYNSAGVLLGDYDFVNQVTEVAAAGYRYDFWLTGPAASSGSQTVSAEDRRHGTLIREFWPSGDLTARGYVSYLTISDATFSDLEAGKETRLEFDGPENPRAARGSLGPTSPTPRSRTRSSARPGGASWPTSSPS